MLRFRDSGFILLRREMRARAAVPLGKCRPWLDVPPGTLGVARESARSPVLFRTAHHECDCTCGVRFSGARVLPWPPPPPPLRQTRRRSGAKERVIERACALASLVRGACPERTGRSAGKLENKTKGARGRRNGGEGGKKRRAGRAGAGRRCRGAEPSAARRAPLPPPGTLGRARARESARLLYVTSDTRMRVHLRRSMFGRARARARAGLAAAATDAAAAAPPDKEEERGKGATWDKTPSSNAQARSHSWSGAHVRDVQGGVPHKIKLVSTKGARWR
jgi:hypothetical protein